MNKIRLKFLGAIETVTGSCTLMEYNKTHYYLIDAGSYQNEGDEVATIREKEIKKYAKKIEIIFLTHAHLDHIGLLPDLITWGFQGKIFGTKATIDLTRAMLDDAMKINGKDSDEINKTNKRMNFIEFDRSEGESIFAGFGKKYFPIDEEENFAVTILRSAHILGSCTWLFRWAEKEYRDDIQLKDREWRYIYFTGDIGPKREDIKPNIFFKDHQIPFSNPNKKITIIMESTYGDRIRDKKNYTYMEKIKKLAEIILENINNLRFVLIPVFALDRAQQVLVDLFYIKEKYKIDGKRMEEIINIDWNNLLCDKNKDIIISLFCKNKLAEEENAMQTEQKAKKHFKRQIEEIFKADDKFQELSQEKKDKIIKLLKYKGYIDIGVKSPLVRRINGIYSKHLTDDVYSQKERRQEYKYLSNEFLEKFNLNKEVISSKNDIKDLLKKCFEGRESGNVVVASSGMCDEGAVVGLLKDHLKDENTTIILTGYQAKGTNGWLLKNYRDGKYEEDNKKDRMQLHNIDIKLSEVKCKIEDLSVYYSGHADQEQLVNYVFQSKNDFAKMTVLLTHGTKEAREKLKYALCEKEDNISVFLPEFNRWFDIISEEYDAEETDETNYITDAETMRQFKYMNIGEAHLYFPQEYDEDKLKKIIEFITEVDKSMPIY